MDSIVVYTEEIDDLNDAVDELFEKMEGFTFRKNSLGILMTEEDTNYQELYSLLSEKLDFPIMGCTSMAMFSNSDGYCAGGISLMILTADDCEFAAGVTQTLTKESSGEEIQRLYSEASEKLDGDVKLIISYGVIVSDEKDVSGDDQVNALSKISGGVPVFGGLSSDGFNFTQSRVFFNDQIVENGLAMALVSGEIHPQFFTVNSIGNRASISYEITESTNNQVYKLGNETLLNMLKKEDFTVDKANVLADYLLTPFVVSIEQPDGERVEAARNLSILNLEDESGTFLGAMPQGAYLGVGIIGREDVQRSVDKVFEEITNRIEYSEYKYTTFLCTSCAARFLALASDVRAEAAVCKNRTPEGMSLLGMYSYGEFCPVIGKKSGDMYNMFHNFTFTILAM